MSGITLETCTDTNGGQDVTSLNTRDWIDYNVTAASTGSYTIQYRYQNSSTTAYQLQLRVGSTAIVTTSLPPATAWTTTANSTTFTLNAGTQTLRLYAGYGGAGLKVNWLQFSSSAISNNPDLINLTLSQGTLSPAFSASSTSYTDTVVNSVTSMTVTPTTAGPGATISVNGTAVANGTASQAISLNLGNNTINVVVTAQDGTTTKTYTITVTRLRSSNADLSGLTISQGTLTPAFAAATTSYTDSVADTVTDLTVTPSASDTNSTIRVNGTIVASGTASGSISLNLGSNTINVVVTAQNGSTTKTYTIIATREETIVADGMSSGYSSMNVRSTVDETAVIAQVTPTTEADTITPTPAESSNCDLSSLFVSQGTLSPAFAPGTRSYTDSVNHSISSLTITPTAADPGATITVNGSAISSGSASQAIWLTDGNNTINVVVIAADNVTTKIYSILVNRAAASNNADLSNITLNQGILNPTFSSAQTSYTDSVANSVTSMTVTTTAADTLATISINGTTSTGGSASQTINLNVGTNTISIVVVAENGITTKTYTLTVTRAPSSNADLSTMAISQGTLDPVFASSTMGYSVSVLNSVAGLTVTPTAADAGATVTVNGSAVTSGSASQPINLGVGSNIIQVVVVAADGTTTKTYMITVFRSAYNKMIPSLIEAEGYDAQSGIMTSPTTDSSGSQDLTNLATGNYADYNICVETTGTYLFQVRAFNPNPSSQYTLELRSGMSVIATVTIPANTNWSTQAATVPIDLSSGDKTLRLHVSNGDSLAFRVNWIQLTKQ